MIPAGAIRRNQARIQHILQAQRVADLYVQRAGIDLCPKVARKGGRILCDQLGEMPRGALLISGRKAQQAGAMDGFGHGAELRIHRFGAMESLCRKEPP